MPKLAKEMKKPAMVPGTREAAFIGRLQEHSTTLEDKINTVQRNDEECQRVDRVERAAPRSPKADEVTYYKKTAIFRIMHVIGIRRQIVEQYPWIPINLYHAFNQAKDIAMKRMVNPRIAPLVWYREAWEEQEEILGPDPWEYGMTEKNRNQLEILLGYAHEQGTIERPMPLDELFIDITQGRKRGDEFRM